ncbi:MAG: plasmid mobilization protein [Treponema sp.]
MAETVDKPKYSGYGYHGGGRKPTGVKRVSFSVSCQPEELAELKRRAKLSGKTVSKFILDAVLK